MTEERVVEDATEALSSLRREFDDFRTTVMVRATTRPVGDMEPTLRQSPKPGTLLLQGQTLNRADYVVLWQWAVDQDLIDAGLFGAGNGTTTFVLPDLRGRVIIGAGTLGTDVYALGGKGGAARIQQTIAQMARHSHTGATATDAHSHTEGNTGGGGQHGNHPGFQIPVQSGTGANDVWAGGPATHFDHTHDVFDTGSDTHSHGIPLDGGSSGNAGPGDAMDIRNPYLVINWQIWT